MFLFIILLLIYRLYFIQYHFIFIYFILRFLFCILFIFSSCWPENHLLFLDLCLCFIMVGQFGFRSFILEIVFVQIMLFSNLSRALQREEGKPKYNIMLQFFLCHFLLSAIRCPNLGCKISFSEASKGSSRVLAIRRSFCCVLTKTN